MDNASSEALLLRRKVIEKKELSIKNPYIEVYWPNSQTAIFPLRKSIAGQKVRLSVQHVLTLFRKDSTRSGHFVAQEQMSWNFERMWRRAA